MNNLISRVFRKGGKVTFIHCGTYPNITVYRRIDVNGERFFILDSYGKHRLYQPNKKTRRMEYVKTI